MGLICGRTSSMLGSSSRMSWLSSASRLKEECNCVRSGVLLGATIRTSSKPI